MFTCNQLRFLMTFPLLAAVGSLGCKSDDAAPLDPAVEAPLMASRARAVLDTTSQSLTFMEQENTLLSRLGTKVAEPPLVRRSGTTVMAMVARAVPPLRAAFDHPEKKLNPAGALVAATLQDDASMSSDLESFSADLEVLLRDRIMVASNLESQSADKVVYLLKPDVTCQPLPSEVEQTPDPDCVADLPKLQVRVVMTRESDGVRLSVVLGANQDQMFALIVRGDRLGVELDLPAMKKALDFSRVALGEAPFDPDLQMKTGKLRFEVRRLGAKAAGFEVSVLQDVDLQVLDAQGQPEMTFRTARREGPAISAVFNGETRVATLSQDVGATEIHAPYDPQDTGVPNQNLKVLMGGITWQTTLNEASQELNIKGLGLGAGPTSVDVRGLRVFQLDVNPSDGRKFDLRVTMNAAEQATLEITPKVDVAAAFKLGLIQADFKEPPAAELLDETYRLQASGANPVVLETVAHDEATGFDGGIKVVAGSLLLASSKGAMVSVAAGQCLVSKEAAATDHPLLGGFAAGMCAAPAP